MRACLLVLSLALFCSSCVETRLATREAEPCPEPRTGMPATGLAERSKPKLRVATGLTNPFPLDAARRARLAAAMPEVEAFLGQKTAELGCPGAAWGVVLGSELLWWKGYGVRDLARRDPVDRETVFRIGSLTKTFTGVALMLLRDDGRVDFDEPVQTYVPEAGGIVYPSADSPPITAWHLVTHSSGLPRIGAFDYTRGDHDVTEAELLGSLDGLYLESAPNVRPNYSNLGFALAGIVVQRASGVRYRDFVTTRILEPIGMTSTVWDPRAVPPGRLATGYELRNGKRVATPHWRLGAAEAMGGLYSTLGDLAKYAGFELSAWPPRDGEETGLLKRSILRESQLSAGDGWAPGQTTGVAWAVRWDPEQGHLVTHSGAVGNYSAVIRLLPARSLGIVGMCSTGDAPERLEAAAHETLAAIVRRDPQPPPPLSKPIETAFGRIEQHLTRPSEAEIRRSFSSSFLQDLGSAQMLDFFTQARKQSGACSARRALAAEGLYSATVHLQCERQSWKVTLRTAPKPPFLIEALWFNPAGRD